MAITQTFSDMINEYLPEDLLRNELVKRDWFLSNVKIVEGWNGGAMDVGFKEASANSINYGSLESSSNIGQSVLVRGTVSGYKHVSSSMIFNHRDLLEHGSSQKMSKKSFLKILPDEINDHLQVLREIISCNLLNGKKLAKGTADATVGGVATLDRPERLAIGMKVEFHDSVPTASVNGYVSAINLDTRQVSFVTARGGATPVDLSGWDLANDYYVTIPGADDAAFAGLKDMILSAANGGSASLYGKTKASYTYLQSYNHDGSAITATSILGTIFDAYTTHKIRYKGDARKIVMSLKNMSAAMKEVQASKGAYNVVVGSQKQSVYFSEISIIGVGGGVLELVGVQEMDDDVVLGLDMSAFKFETNNLIRRIKSPEGLEYFTVRNTTGYQFILDHECYGELVLTTPQKCFAIHSISF